MIISSFVKIFNLKFSEKFWKKSQKTSYLENYKNLSSLTDSNNRIDIFKVLELFNLEVFFENFGKNHKKHHISKTTRFEQS